MLSKEEVLDRLKSLHKNLNRRPIKKDSSSLYSLSRKYFGSWNNMMKEAGYEIYVNQTPSIPKLNSPELYYLLGLTYSDGHLYRREWRYKLMLFTSSDEEKEIILNLFDYLFNYEASVRIKHFGFSKFSNYEIYVCSKRVCELMHWFGVPYGAKCEIIRVPKKVFNTKRNYKWNFIRGVFDGDGSFVYTGSNSIFKISSKSKKFIVDLKNILISLDIQRPIVYQEREDLWQLRVCNKPDQMRIYNGIYADAKYFYPRKKQKWEPLKMRQVKDG